MKNILYIFGIFLFLCSGAILSSAQRSCGVGKNCVRPEHCKTLDNYNALSDHSVCNTFERCCIAKRIHPTPRKPNAPRNCGISNPRGLLPTSEFADEDEAKFGQFPWVVQIYESVIYMSRAGTVPRSAGSLVAPNVVLTTAHNIANTSVSQLWVRAGEWDTRSTMEAYKHVDLNAQKMIIHENYNERSLNFDIAIVILKRRFRLSSHIRTICLPQPDVNFDHSRCVVTGWGKKQKTDTDYSPILKKIDVSVVDRATCQAQLRESLNFQFFELQSSFICAGGDVENPCDGDGGAPLMCPVVGSANRYELAGVLSFSSKCNPRDAPAVYVNVAMLRSWILANMQRKRGANLSASY